MMEEQTTSLISSKLEGKRIYLRVDILIALWALAESALGGILHAFRIPFTGLFVNSCAVIFMVLIASATDKRGTILRATLIVMIIKGMVSPHTPLTAFIAVGFQGLMGEFLLRSKKYLILSSIALGVVTLLQSALQKIILLTIIYGNSLWETIDVFVNFIIKQVPFLPIQDYPVQFSFWLIVSYVSIHIIAGILVGIMAARMPAWLEKEIRHQRNILQISEGIANFEISMSKAKRSWIKKPSTYVILSLAVIIIFLSYVFKDISETQGMQAIIMIIRSTFILIVWYTVAGPYLLKLSKRFLRSKHNTHAREVEKTMQILIPMRYIIYKTWNDSAQFSGIGRFKNFIKLSLVNILSTEFRANEDN
jgi:hypothetical protein